VCVCVRACLRVCLRACVCACVRLCVRARACARPCVCARTRVWVRACAEGFGPHYPISTAQHRSTAQLIRLAGCPGAQLERAPRDPLLARAAPPQRHAGGAAVRARRKPRPVPMFLAVCSSGYGVRFERLGLRQVRGAGRAVCISGLRGMFFWDKGYVFLGQGVCIFGTKASVLTSACGRFGCRSRRIKAPIKARKPPLASPVAITSSAQPPRISGV
jgi:hypothetical protein